MIHLKPARAAIALYFALGAGSANSQDFSRELPPLGVSVLTAPVAARSGDQYLLAYELQLSSYHSKYLTLDRIEVLTPPSQVVMTFEGESLAKAFAAGMPHKQLLPDGQSTGALVALLLSSVPKSIAHRVQFRLADNPDPLIVETDATPVHTNRLRISAPLRGDAWIASNGPGGNNHHTGGVMPYRGRPRVPQRFAIDFVRLFEEGVTHRGDPKDNRSYRCHGAEAIAVANARVADVRDGIPENVPDREKRAVKMTVDTVTGNRVVLDLGRGRFAHYAHLQPGSIRVRKGARVRRGEVLGLVGNSGNSTEAHLHFQVSDSAAILEGDGLPFEIDQFLNGGKPARNQMPRDGWVLSFR